jgi:hypothetical protein
MSSGLCVIAIVMTWAMVGYDYYDRNSPHIAEFEFEPASIVSGWGQQNNSCFMS